MSTVWLEQGGQVHSHHQVPPFIYRPCSWVFLFVAEIVLKDHIEIYKLLNQVGEVTAGLATESWLTRRMQRREGGLGVVTTRRLTSQGGDYTLSSAVCEEGEEEVTPQPPYLPLCLGQENCKG